MAVLGTLRKQTGLTIVVIGFAMLSFLVVDAFSNNPLLMGGGDPNNLANINGTKVSIQDYETLRKMASQSQQNANENQLNTQVWNQLVESTLLADRAADVGLEASPMQVAAQFFGLDSEEEAEAQLAQIKAAAQQGNPQAQQQYNYWLQFQGQFTKSYLGNAYRNLISQAVVATEVDAKFTARANGESAQIEYALAPYASLETKNKVEISDEEITNYVNKYQSRFKRPAMVNLSTVFFPAAPSAADEKAVLNEISKFTTTQLIKDANGNVVDTIQAFANVKNDSVFVSNYSDAPFTPNFLSFAQLSGNPELANFAKSAAPGEIKGPFKFGQAYFLSKLLKRETVDSARTSHILITFQKDSATEGRSKVAAKALADSLLTLVRTDVTQFAALAQTYSEDPGSKDRGGSYPWMTKEAGYVKPYKDFAFGNPAGTTGVVESDFGYHVMKVDEKKAGVGFKLANIIKNISSSKATDNKLFEDVNKFVQDVKDKDLNTFVNKAAEKNYAQNDAKNLERYAPSLGYLSTDKDAEVLRWAFNKDTELGDVLQFPTADGSYVVAKLTARSKAGLASASQAREQVEPLLKQKKLTEMIAAKGNLSLDDLVNQFGATKDSARVSLGTSAIAGKGIEPAVVGTAIGLQNGSVSKPIQGNAGVYIVRKLETIGTARTQDLSTQRRASKEAYLRLVNSQMMQAIRENADVEDNRADLLQ